MKIPAVVRQSFQVYVDGDPAVKLAASGFAAIAAALHEVTTTLVFAVLALFWGLDMLSGIIRAISEGFDKFRWMKFFEGFLALIAGLIGIGLAVGVDLLAADFIGRFTDLKEAVAGRYYLTNAAMIAIAAGFGASAAENIEGFWPALGRGLSKILNRGRQAAEDRLSLSELPETTQMRIRAILEEELGR